jgi:hypothetical protein
LDADAFLTAATRKLGIPDIHVFYTSPAERLDAQNGELIIS